MQVLIICPVNGDRASVAVEEARAAGVKVIAYDRLILNTEAVDYYITFDAISIGRAQGQYVIDQATGAGKPLFLYAGAARIITPSSSSKAVGKSCSPSLSTAPS